MLEDNALGISPSIVAFRSNPLETMAVDLDI